MNFIAIAFTYVGTIIGAGFASGQEIKKFFVDYGGAGLVALLLSGVLFFYIGRKIALLGYYTKANSYEGILESRFSSKVRKVIDIIITFFLFGSFSTMLSGMGAFFYQSLSIDYHVGSVLLMVISGITVMFGIKTIMKANTVIVPILIIGTCVIAIISVSKPESGNSSFIPDNINSGYALFSGVLYAAYNLIMAISILPSVGTTARNRKAINVGIAMGSGIIVILGIIIYFSLYLNYGTIQKMEVPLEFIAKGIPGWSILYKISFTLSVFTTAVGTLYGIYSRMNKNAYVLFVTLISAYLCSLIGFSSLITYLYSFMGYAGIIILGMIIVMGNSEKRKQN